VPFLICMRVTIALVTSNELVRIGCPGHSGVASEFVQQARK
jgi:hypothetical protein